MAQKPVLREDLEQELLPSGLQASLLLHATHRQRRNLGVTAQYRRRRQPPNPSIMTSEPLSTTSTNNHRSTIENGIDVDKDNVTEICKKALVDSEFGTKNEAIIDETELPSGQLDSLSRSLSTSSPPVTIANGHIR